VYAVSHAPAGDWLAVEASWNLVNRLMVSTA